MSETIYVVQGTTGEYSDRTDWVVCAYRDSEMAEEHASKAMHRAKEIEKSRESRFHETRAINEYDPDMQMDYTGTAYTTYPVEIRDVLP